MSDKNDFYSLLEDEHITHEYYEHALKVWNEYGMENMGGYHGLYFKTQVLLLADVFKEFRNMFLEFYALDPCDYFNSPGFS